VGGRGFHKGRPSHEERTCAPVRSLTGVYRGGERRGERRGMQGGAQGERRGERRYLPYRLHATHRSFPAPTPSQFLAMMSMRVPQYRGFQFATSSATDCIAFVLPSSR
jgi:hypothetical protein